MANLFSFGLNILADILYPKYCFGCGRAVGYLCKFCIKKLPFNIKNLCIVCNKLSTNGITHTQCKNNFLPNRLLSAFPYKNKIVRDMIITGKYYFVSEIFYLLGKFGAFVLLQNQSSLSQFEVFDFTLCPIPLHIRRKNWRGFNQSEVICQAMSEVFEIPYQNILVRTKNTKTQKDLSAPERQSNMQNAFAISKDFFGNIPHKVILIDDVTTTGKTFLEATRVLKQAGVQEVWCVSLAKD